MLSTIEKAVEVYTLHAVPTFVRELVEEAAEKDGRPYEVLSRRARRGSSRP